MSAGQPEMFRVSERNMLNVYANGISMYYETHGGGGALVLRLGTDLTVCGPIINRLSQDFTVLAFDNRGAGRTDKPDIPYTMKMMAEDTADSNLGGVEFQPAGAVGRALCGAAVTVEDPV